MTEDVRFRPEALVAVGAVETGLALARARTGADEVQFKGARDLVTATDIAVEDAVRKVIGEKLGVPVLGEERGDAGAAVRGSYWLVDPICGTRNFASGIPLYCINVALVEDGEVTIAVIGDPPASEIFVAERGHGAWARHGDDWLRVAVSDHSRTIVIEDSHADPDGERRERAANAVASAIKAFRWDIRALSTTLALPYVATGRVAAYVLFWTSAIHAAAGSLLASEAGGVVSDIDGGPWSPDSDSIIASATPALHAELLEIAKDRAGADSTEATSNRADPRPSR